jgi:hypothetical protein
MQTAATEFPVVSGQLPNTDVYALTEQLYFQEKQITDFGEGFRVGVTGGYRVSSRLGFEMGFNHFKSNKNYGRNR